MLTPCCTSSACYECLKSYLTSDHKFASSRAGVCPFPDCKQQDVFVQDLIFNHALTRAAEWFRRQQISKMVVEDLEIEQKQMKSENDIFAVAKQLIE
jgi:hypothetical protein